MEIPDLVWPRLPANYDDELLLDIEAGIVTFLTRGRNAWHGKWVRHWFQNTHIFADVAGAKRGAESLRSQGSVFYIREVPALVLRGPDFGVVLCDINGNYAFRNFTGIGSAIHEVNESRWVDGIYPGVSLRDAVSVFDEDSGFWEGHTPGARWILRGLVEKDFKFAQRSGPLASLHSYPQGSGYWLGWFQHGTQYEESCGDATALAARWSDLTSGEGLSAGKSSYSKYEQFVEYRNNVLSALPRSVWEAERAKKRAASRAAIEDAESELFNAMERAIRESLENPELN